MKSKACFDIENVLGPRMMGGETSGGEGQGAPPSHGKYAASFDIDYPSSDDNTPSHEPILHKSHQAQNAY
jgi:hypothetical protein